VVGTKNRIDFLDPEEPKAQQHFQGENHFCEMQNSKYLWCIKLW